MRENAETREKILKVLRTAEPYDVYTINELAFKCGVLRITAQRHLYKLIALNDEFKRLAVYKVMVGTNREYIVKRGGLNE